MAIFDVSNTVHVLANWELFRCTEIGCHVIGINIRMQRSDWLYEPTTCSLDGDRNGKLSQTWPDGMNDPMICVTGLKDFFML